MNFDESLAELVRIVDTVLGPEALDECAILRDATGRLSLVSSQPVSDKKKASLADAARSLGEYADSTAMILTPEELGDPKIVEDSRPFVVSVHDRPRLVNIVDQRIAGQDWTARPFPGWRSPEPARFVFWSLKGGVGRTTATSVAAVDLARAGKRVLVLDLDLEAPGLSTMLLRPEELPENGSLDWFVENGLAMLDDRFIDSTVGTSSFSQSGGILDVVPAMGRRSNASPQNVIPKLGRAYIEDVNGVGETVGFLAQTRELVEKLLTRGKYDVVLIDARAGLNESTAASFFGLGADIMMFGINTPQTFDGYKYLMAYLRGLPADPNDDWRLRLKLVHAKADLKSRPLFRDRAFALFSEYMYEEESGDGDAFNFDLDDEDAPHYALVIADDSNYREFDPLSAADQVTERVYGATFGDFLDGLRKRIGSID